MAALITETDPEAEQVFSVYIYFLKFGWLRISSKSVILSPESSAVKYK